MVVRDFLTRLQAIYVVYTCVFLHCLDVYNFVIQGETTSKVFYNKYFKLNELIFDLLENSLNQNIQIK